MRLYSIRLLVEDFDACFRFYRDMIGLEPAWGEEGGRYADFKAGNGTFLALFKRDLMAATVSADQLPHDTPTQDRAALVFQTDDLDGTAAELQGKGVEFVNEPKDYPAWTIRAAHFRDPDGNLIELFAPLPKEKWAQDLRDEDLRSKTRR
jgi:catechol 2,3-dioxygenase-like lactoylglutathione lyase family enzyme